MADDALPRPTFAGRLRVADFMYGGDGGVEAAAAAEAASAGTSPRRRAGDKRRRGGDADGEAGDDKDNKDGDDDKDDKDDDDSVNDTAAPREPSRRRRRRVAAPSPYASPGPPTYAHLALLPDALAPNLLVLFVGLNPGVETARSGHAYAHPSNLFWKLLHSSGVVPERCSAVDDRSLPARFRLGLTNIVARPSRNGAELRPAELDAGVAVLEAKARRWRPEVMCLVGKGIWDSVVRVRRRRAAAAAAAAAHQAADPSPSRQRQPPPATRAFCYGWQDATENMGAYVDDAADDAVADGVRVDPDWPGARVFVASSTSGLAATLRPAEKEAIWRQLGEWVQMRREELKQEAAEAAEAAGGRPPES